MSEKKMKCMFFCNGNTMFFKNENQVPKLQKSWLKLYLEFLEKQGINPLEVEFDLPDRKEAIPFKTTSGDYGWEITVENIETENKVHLCNSCKNKYPSCNPKNVIFGTGVGLDNIIACEKYKAYSKPKEQK